MSMGEEYLSESAFERTYDSNSGMWDVRLNLLETKNIWLTRTGRISIFDMDLSHLTNSINLIRNKWDGNLDAMRCASILEIIRFVKENKNERL